MEDAKAPHELLPIIPIILNQTEVEIRESQQGQMIKLFHKAMGLLQYEGRPNDILNAFYIHREAHLLPPLPIFITVSSSRRGLNAFLGTSKIADKIIGLDVHIQYQTQPTGTDLQLLQGEKLGNKWVHLTLIIPTHGHAGKALYELLELLHRVPACLRTVKRLTVRRATSLLRSPRPCANGTGTGNKVQLRHANQPHRSVPWIPTLSPTHLDAEAWSLVVLQDSTVFRSLTSICVTKIRLSDGIELLNRWIRLFSTIKSLTHIELATESDTSFMIDTIRKFQSPVLQSITLRSTPWSCMSAVLDAFEDCPLVSELNIRGQDDIHAYEDVNYATSEIVATINRRLPNLTRLVLSVSHMFSTPSHSTKYLYNCQSIGTEFFEHLRDKAFLPTLTELTLLTPYEDVVRADKHVFRLEVRMFDSNDRLWDDIEQRILHMLKNRQGILKLLCLHVGDRYQLGNAFDIIPRPSTMFRAGLNLLHIHLKVVRKHVWEDTSIPYMLPYY